MDAFRRLRSRRKSKGQADSFLSFAEAESGPRSPVTPWHSSAARPSATVSRPSDLDRNFIHDYLPYPKSSTDIGTAVPSGRVQPTTVGVSRPFLNNPRPGTVESLQQALDRAADSISYSPPRWTASPSQQFGFKTGKYVDIFAIAGQSGRASTTFNEDVAERNLDSVPLMTEDAHPRYEPTSKYQEEVATRNASRSVVQRASLSRFPHVSENVKSASRPPDLVTSYFPQLPPEDSPKHQRPQNPTAYRAHQDPGLAQHVTNRSPAHLRERSSRILATTMGRNDTGARPENELERARFMDLELHTPEGHFKRSGDDEARHALPREDGRLHISEIYANTTSPNKRRSDISISQLSERVAQDSHQISGQSTNRKLDRTPSYQMSLDEARARTRSTAPVLQRSDSYGDNTRRLELLRPSSTMSTTSSAKRLTAIGTRRIMDLTNDDAEVLSIVSYMNTPEIDDAYTGAFRKLKPAVVVNPSPTKILVEEDPIVPKSRWSSAFEPVLDLDQLARQSQMVSDNDEAVVAADNQALPLPEESSKPPLSRSLSFSPVRTLTSTTPPRTFSFSPISTLSTSPRSSQVIALPQQDIQSTSLQMPVNQPDQQSKPPTSKALELDAIPQQLDSEVSVATVPLVKATADVSPDDVEAMPQPLPKVNQSPPNVVDSRTSKGTAIVSRRDRKKDDNRAEGRADSARRSARTAIPAGPIDLEATPEIKTRDFAALLVEKPATKGTEVLTERKRSPAASKRSPREDINASSAMKASSSTDKKNRSRSAKSVNKVAFEEKPTTITASDKKPEKQTERKSSRKSSKQISDTPKKPRPRSIFDEAAFKKKQSEATVALLRLQESLQENLENTDSDLDTPRDTTRPAEKQQSKIPGSQAMPTQYHSSPSLAAIAMIAAATSSPRTRTRPGISGKSYSEYGQISRGPARVAGVVRSNTENDLPTVRSINSQGTGTTAPNPALARVDANDIIPPSPGEVSLSAFPLPAPQAATPDMEQSPPSYVKDVIPAPVRRGSQASHLSSASAFSIPFTMVPGRASSLPTNRLPVPASSTVTMNSIDSVIPPQKSVEIDGS